MLLPRGNQGSSHSWRQGTRRSSVRRSRRQGLARPRRIAWQGSGVLRCDTRGAVFGGASTVDSPESQKFVKRVQRYLQEVWFASVNFPPDPVIPETGFLVCGGRGAGGWEAVSRSVVPQVSRADRRFHGHEAAARSSPWFLDAPHWQGEAVRAYVNTVNGPQKPRGASGPLTGRPPHRDHPTVLCCHRCARLGFAVRRPPLEVQNPQPLGSGGPDGFDVLVLRKAGVGVEGGKQLRGVPRDRRARGLRGAPAWAGRSISVRRRRQS